MGPDLKYAEFYLQATRKLLKLTSQERQILSIFKKMRPVNCDVSVEIETCLNKDIVVPDFL
jgi:hypothetical protein